MRTTKRYGMKMVRKHGIWIDSRWLSKGPTKMGGWDKPPKSRGFIQDRTLGFSTGQPKGFKWPREYRDAPKPEGDPKTTGLTMKQINENVITWSKQSDPRNWDSDDAGDG